MSLEKKDDSILEIDLAPFERTFPKMNQVRSIDNGMEFPNRRFSSRLAMEYLESQPLEMKWADLKDQLQQLGFEPGWGRTLAGIKKGFSILANLLEAPDHNNQIFSL